MKEIILPTEIMAFFILNMFAHDSALHDFTTSSALGKGRALTVLGKSVPTSPGSSVISLSGGDKGSEDKELDDAVETAYKNTVAPSLLSCLKLTGFFDITRNDNPQSDSFIIVDVVLATKISEQMGIAPGFIYLPEKTYSPFEFVLSSSNNTTKQFIYTHDQEKWTITIDVSKEIQPFLLINRGGVVTSYNLLSKTENLKPKLEDIISINPDVSDAFLSNTALSKITNYMDYIQLLLDGSESRYTLILNEYLKSGTEYMDSNSAESVNVKNLSERGKGDLTASITSFWSDFIGVSNDNFLSNMFDMLGKIEQIHQNFALIYKAILFSIASGNYSCSQSLTEIITDKASLDKFYNENKLELEMFVYQYMVSSQSFEKNQSQSIKENCNKFIQDINDSLSDHRDKLTPQFIEKRLKELDNCKMIILPNDFNYTTIDSNSILDQYPLTYFAENSQTNETEMIIDTQQTGRVKRKRDEDEDEDEEIPESKKMVGGTDPEPMDVADSEICKDNNDINYVKQLTTFTNFLQIVVNTLIGIETDKEEEETDLDAVREADTNEEEKEMYINILTNLQIIANNSDNDLNDIQPELINIVKHTLEKLFVSDSITQVFTYPDYTTILTESVGSENVDVITNVLIFLPTLNN